MTDALGVKLTNNNLPSAGGAAVSASQLQSGAAGGRVNTRTNMQNAFERLIEHCGEQYPHFESLRGQQDIRDAKAHYARLVNEHAALKEAAKQLGALAVQLESSGMIVPPGVRNALDALK